MTQQVKVRERQIRLTLYELDEETLEKKGKKPICELFQFQTVFALNSIPDAVIVPLLGENIQTKKKSKEVPLAKLHQLVEKTAPVGVYVSFITRYNSKSNRTDMQYWPKGETCIFKGYIRAYNAGVSAYKAFVSFTITHWLTALANISLLTTASSVNNPDHIALRTYGIAAVGEGASKVWGQFKLAEGLKLSKVWETGIKQLFLQVLQWGDTREEKDRLNPFVKKERKRIRLVLDKIESDSMDLHANTESGLSQLNTLIAGCLKMDNYPSFINTCAWRKLIQVYAPMFLFAVVPRVDKASIIPVPCVVDKDRAIELTGKDVFQMQMAPFMPRQVSRVICTADIGPAKVNTSVGEPYYVSYGVYPPLGEVKEGMVNVIALPGWLCQVIPTKSVGNSFPSVYEKPKVDNVKKNQEKVKKANDVQKTVGQCYAKYAYLVQSYNNTVATISTPFRMDICPGAMVKVHIDGSKHDITMYGTVASVQINLQAGTTPANTTIQLTNIRSEEAINDKIDNPKDGAGYYKQQWSGKGEALYAEKANARA